MTDPQGNELFHITNKLVSFRKTILGTDKAEDRQLFKVVKKISCTFVRSFVHLFVGSLVRSFWSGSLWGCPYWRG